MEGALRNVRYAIRVLRNDAGFTAVTVIALALGIGANTAIFSVVNAVLLRPLPFPHPEQLVLVHDNLTGRQINNVGLSVPELQDLQERSGVFEEVSAVWPVDANLTGSDRPERIELMAVSPNYFSLLGASAQLGRVLGEQDRAQGFAEAVVISDGLWRRLFGADPNVLGKKVRADNDVYTVVGVMPPGFRHPAQTLRADVDMWATAGFAGNPFGPPVRAARILPGAIARIKIDLTLEQAQAQLDNFIAQLRNEFPGDYPPDAGWEVRLLPARENLVGDFRTTLLVLLGAVGLVLLIGCVNIANLMLARSLGRQREMSIRLALGASRRRLVTQLLTESVLLGLLGGGLALLVAGWVTDLLLRIVPSAIPRLNEVNISGGVLAFTFIVSLLTGVAFGLVPALQSSRADVLSNLKEGSSGSGTSIRTNRLRGLLVIAEVALSLVLMLGAGLLLRSFSRLMEVDPGFEARNVLLQRIWLPVPNNPELDPYRPPEKRVAFVREVLRRVRQLPGVHLAAIGSGNGVPLIGPHNKSTFTVEGRAEAVPPLQAQTSAVSADYFATLGTRLIDGRVFAEGDDQGAPWVALIDQTMASRIWPDENPIGKRVKFGRGGSNAPWMTIIGIVGNVKTDGFDSIVDQPHLYISILQSGSYAMALYVKSDVSPLSLAGSIRQQVQAVDPDLPVFGEQTMEDVVASSLAERRFAMQLVGTFAFVALLLAAVGIYGVMAYTISHRTREIGLRLALGASGSHVLRWVLKQGITLTLFGVGLGVLAGLGLMRLLQNLLFEIDAADPLTFGAVAVLLTSVGLAACLAPARRAIKVDPMIALKYE